jgi:hypothetical protein
MKFIFFKEGHGGTAFLGGKKTAILRPNRRKKADLTQWAHAYTRESDRVGPEKMD